MNELAKVNRFEVIDHRENGEGRAMVVHGNNLKVETSLQDNDRTLKIFITDTKSPIPVNRAEVNKLYALNLLKQARAEEENPDLDRVIEYLVEHLKS